MRRFAVSDIHGCAATFRVLLDKIALAKEDHLFLLGDYIDRGPDSKGVIDTIMNLQNEGYQIECLLGNHELMMFNGLEPTWENQLLWLSNGGFETLDSFNTGNLLEVPDIYFDFLRGLNDLLEIDHYIMVHAGLPFKDKNDPFKPRKDLVWTRYWYDRIDREWLRDRIIIHGHTPVDKTVILEQIKNLDQLPVINIDAGCVFPEQGLGYLCALDLDNLEVIFQENVEG